MAKKRKLLHHVSPPGRHHGPTSHRKSHGSAKPHAPSKPPRSSKTKPQRQHDAPTIPFDPSDRILLVGDGDLSFAASLVTHHQCTDLTATVLEKSLDELAAKYPQAVDNAATIDANEGTRIVYGVDATKMGPFGGRRRRKRRQEAAVSGRDDNERGASTSDDEGDDGDDTDAGKSAQPLDEATSKAAPSKTSSSSGSMQRIIFNFPHVGGKSTDVNRQVRANQSLLVAFFQRAAGSSDSSSSPAKKAPAASSSSTPILARGGTIIVTLFEAEPYTLWNIRDLARHCGLQVQRSFRFQPSAYPGYRHARTLGALRDKDGEVTGGAWRGEERAARTYVLVRKDEEELITVGRKGGKRRRDSDDEGWGEDDDEE